MESLCARRAVAGIFRTALVSEATDEVDVRAPNGDGANRCCGVKPEVVLATTENRALIIFSERTIMIVMNSIS